MIYFIQCSTGPIKIGSCDNDIAARLGRLQVGCPYELRLVATMEGNLEEEVAIQAKFSALRLRGEWFWPSQELLDWVGNPKEIFVQRKQRAVNSSCLAEQIREHFSGKEFTCEEVAGALHRPEGSVKMTLNRLPDAERLSLGRGRGNKTVWTIKDRRQ